MSRIFLNLRESISGQTSLTYAAAPPRLSEDGTRQRNKNPYFTTNRDSNGIELGNVSVSKDLSTIRYAYDSGNDPEEYISEVAHEADHVATLSTITIGFGESRT